MTVRVHTVSPDTPLKEVAGLLLRERISGVPVMEGERLVGILSESDLQPLREGAPDRRIRVAADVMTRDVVTLQEHLSVTEAARVLDRHHVKRAPVLRGDRLVGILTRSDLLRPYIRTDGEILAEVEDAVVRGSLGMGPSQVRVRVREGVVHVEGTVRSERDRGLLLRLARSVDGVVDVAGTLEVRAS